MRQAAALTGRPAAPRSSGERSHTRFFAFGAMSGSTQSSDTLAGMRPVRKTSMIPPVWKSAAPALEGLALHVVDAAGDHDVGFTQSNLAA
ncbi:hypothetical protein HMPREF3158_06020 [Corynebacterium sp. HMSC06G04]|nr:hypothetical protein HMPREF3158_06020 [Corynebacterium sp. HMSC06G04]